MLDPAFVATSAELGELSLCHARLQLDARYPWIVLIPRRPHLREIEQLSAVDRLALMDEIVMAGAAVRAIGAAIGVRVDKLNVGSLGNVTPQLHAHVIGRRSGDPAWPGPVWGHSPAAPFEDTALDAAIAAARGSLGL
jgi:diadenosine tetraphosphate (Ap4A) HIT family hydrolase